MNLVLFTHPAFLGLTSQDHFARMLSAAFAARGHAVSLRRPPAVLRARFAQGRWAKWAGYVDQYLLFPRQIRAALRSDPADTLYVFCDQALGPWIPLLASRPHVVHCHDLLALRSALGDIADPQPAFTGRLYQRYIRRGFRRAKYFISISRRSRDDLHRFGGVAPRLSEVVYNGLNHPFRRVDRGTVRDRLLRAGLPAERRGCLLHVGGGQWYKNAQGVVALYGAYARGCLVVGQPPLPLWMVSPPPSVALQAAIDALPPATEVRFLGGVDVQTLEALYAHARALLFPSLAEGFGWPIAVALACGCPVLTTGEPPMTEVGGDAAVYLPRLQSSADLPAWSAQAARVLADLLARPPADQARDAAAGRARATEFDPDAAIDRYLGLYQRVLAMEGHSDPGSTR